MGGTLRYLLATVFVAVFVALAVRQPDHEYLAFLETRSWLMKAGDGGFAAAVPEGTPMSPLQVDVAPANRVQDYRRIGREWASSKGREIGDGPLLQLQVRIGDAGFRSTLLRYDDSGGFEEVDRFEILRDHTSERYYPDHYALVPAFLAIILAILTGKVIPSLLIGCLAGAFLIARQSVLGTAEHFALVTFWQQTIQDDFRLRIMLFVIFLFMAVGVMARSGGIQGMVEWIRKFARGPVSSQMCSFIIGVLVFFDDYTNCIITGSTMRPLTDRNGVSREKLAYIVDSTAAPIAGVSLISTWVAYEISTFSSQLTEVTKPDGTTYEKSEAFSVFIETIPYRFYCLFALLMVLLTILLRRDFGSMLAAERRARHEGKPVADDAQPMLKSGFAELEAPEDTEIRGSNAFVPVLSLVGCAVGLIIWFGIDNIRADSGTLSGTWDEQLRQILEYTQSERALMWASLVALVLALGLAVGRRALSFGDAARAALRSASSLVFAVLILILAWCIGHVCTDLGTATYLTATVGQDLEPWLLPAVMFLLSSLVAFSTGTSYGTMAILLPNIVVLAHTMGELDPSIGGTALMILTIGAVLEGSIFGDHCSPISDTTVLSSVATASDHLHHVRTQAPYAVLVMVLSLVCGYLPMTLFGRESWPVSWAVALVMMAVWLLTVGRNPAHARS